MGREIKFKFWLSHTNVMTFQHTLAEFPFIIKELTAGIIPLQYIGLKDCKGNEIYEGDIVKWGHLKNSQENPVRIATVKIGPDIQLDCKNIKTPHIFHWGSFAYGSKQIEVIGNIYQNPELLVA
jgi:uncharacterized phage protein (TIGR01671 family)